MRCPKPIQGALILAFLVSFNSPIPAQEPVRTGDRIRVTAQGIKRTTGTLRAVDQRLVMLGGSGSPAIQIPRDSITKLEVSRGKRSNITAGILVGTGAGLLLGAAFAVLAVDAGGSSEISNQEAAAIFAALGGSAGLLIGTIVGASTKTERWQEIPLDRLRVTVGPQPHGRFGVKIDVRLSI